MPMMVMTMVDDRHAFQDGMQRQTHEGEPRDPSEHRFAVAILGVLMGMVVTMLDAI